MRLGRAAILVLLFSMLSISGHAGASPIRLDEPDPANYLQGGPGASEQGLIQQALAMPAVVKAMQVFASRGYVHEVSTDRAGWSDSKIEVALGYSIPGHPDVGGVIWVSTDDYGGVPQTRVLAGLVEIDPITHQVLASSLMNTEPGFEITIADMSKTDSANYGWREAVVDVMEFLACFVTLCTGCGSGCSALFMPPAIATCTTICCVVVAVGCAIAAGSN